MTPKERADSIEAIEGPKIQALVNAAVRIARDPRMPHEEKAERMLTLADRLSQAITPHTPCGGGCSHCCHMATAISGWEARMISRYTGRKMLDPGRANETDLNTQQQLVEKFTGVPCTFLVEGRCSIYPVRPAACRIHHNLEDTSDNCWIAPGGNAVNRLRPTVPEIDLRGYLAANAFVFLNDSFGDIREFFPPQDPAIEPNK